LITYSSYLLQNLRGHLGKNHNGKVIYSSYPFPPNIKKEIKEKNTLKRLMCLATPRKKVSSMDGEVKKYHWWELFQLGR
jgi:hypothetical protein